MSDGERASQSQQSAETGGSLHETKPQSSDPTPPASSGGNGHMSSSLSSSLTSSSGSSSYPSNNAYSSSSSSSVGGVAPLTKSTEEPPPHTRRETGRIMASTPTTEVSTDTYYTPSTSMQNLSGSSSTARKLADFHDELVQQQHSSDPFPEEEEEPATDSGTASTSTPVTVTEQQLNDDRDEVSLDGGADDGQFPSYHSNQQNRDSYQHHKRQSSAGSQCSLSSNPENSQFKTADAHSSDSDVSRNSATTSGFMYDSCSGALPMMAPKEEPDRKSLQSENSYSEQLNTSAESVDVGVGSEHVKGASPPTSVLASGMIKSGGSISSPPGSFKPRVKKKMWYQQIFSTSYKTRSGDFKKIFKDLPIKERLIVDYSCALQKEILLQGRMYVSQNYVSFYANIFGWETQTSVSFNEIESITKEKTALIIPNAIQISTMSEKFFFSSFVTRDTTYVMLFKLWQSALLEDSMTKKELWRLVHTCYGEELGVTSEDETDDMYCQTLVPTSTVSSTLITTSHVDGTKSINIDPGRKRSPSGTQVPVISVENCDDDLNDDDDVEEPRVGSWEWCRLRRESAIRGLVSAGEIGPAIAVGLNIGSSIVTSNGIPITTDQLLKDATLVPVQVPMLPMTHEPSDSSDAEALLESDLRQEISHISAGIVPGSSPVEAVDSGSEGTTSSLPPVCPVDHTAGKEALNTILPCNIDQLFTMLFTNSKFYLDFQLSRKTCDIAQSDWQLADGSRKTRQLTFTVATGQSFGPKQAQVTETQTLLPESRPGLLYTIQSDSVNAGIPYADTFYVNCHYCLSKVSADEARLIVISKVIYKKSTLAKIFIEKNSMGALTDFFNHMERALKDECAKMNIGGVTPTSPIVSNLPRRRHPRKLKGRAPDIPILTRPIGEIGGIIHPGTRPTLSTTAPEVLHDATAETVESSLVMKIILTVLGCLLLLNAFLYFKLSSLETAAGNTSVLYPLPVKFSGETPQSHQEWLMLLQQQETLHRSEVHNWHEILVSAIKILHQAEKDLEHLKTHISTYAGDNVVKAVHRVPIEMLSTGEERSNSISSSESSPINGRPSAPEVKHESNPPNKNDK